MINLPITDKELVKIIEILRKTEEKDLYSKLWTFNFNRKR